jgi:uncharacterized membrane-anchored protein
MNEVFINRVAGLTLFFWIIKILSTTVGETGADYVVDVFGLLNTTSLMGIITIVALLWQVGMKKYFAPAYWGLIVMMSIEGTLITDLLVDDLEISLLTLDIIFSLMMLMIFYVWYEDEGTLSIHTINTQRREIFYWTIVLITFALGTGIGDTISEYLKVGYLNSLILFSLVFIISGILFYSKLLNDVTAFWIAFIVTRPIGASLGDLMIQTPKNGGFGWGIDSVNSVFFLIIIATVFYLSISKIDVKNVEVKHNER